MAPTVSVLHFVALTDGIWVEAGRDLHAVVGIMKSPRPVYPEAWLLTANIMVHDVEANPRPRLANVNKRAQVK